MFMARHHASESFFIIRATYMISEISTDRIVPSAIILYIDPSHYEIFGHNKDNFNDTTVLGCGLAFDIKHPVLHFLADNNVSIPIIADLQLINQ